MLSLILFAANTAGATEAPSQYTIIGWMVVGSLALSSLAVNLVNLVRTNKTQKREVSFGEQFISREVFAADRSEISHRLMRAEANVTELWTTMRQEDESTRQEVRKCFKDIERSLGRIEGQLNKSRNPEE